MLIALSFVALACAAAPARIAPPPLPITLTFARDVSPSLVRMVTAEAAAVWRPSGITFEWHTGAGDRSPAALQIVVNNEHGAAPSSDLPLGWILFDANGVPGRLIHLSYANAVAFLEGAVPVAAGAGGMPIAEREIYLGRSMGRALAHEIGHYLLGSKAHARTGLMRSVLTATELFSPDRARLTVTAPICEGMLTRLFASASTAPSP
jgi:hypothetical protein